MKFATLEGRRVAVWGFGREGRAALAALGRHLPGQPTTLYCNAQEAESLAATDGIDVRTEAPDAAALSAFDFVIKSPGISAYKAKIVAARQQGTVFTSGTALWFGENPHARVIGVTGTKGKSTTAAMIAHLARSLGVRTALAGNIGLPLLELDGQQADLWVIELSSFQTGEAGPLDAGVVTSLYEEHLDWHGSRERYFADKLKLADVARTLVVNGGQPDLLARTAAHPRRVLFGTSDGWHVRNGDLCDGNAVVDPSLTAFKHLPGMHNIDNACAALTALEAAQVRDLAERIVPAAVREANGTDLSRDEMAHSLVSFEPLPHRLQPLGERDGWFWIDDSISTTPETVKAALGCFPAHDVTVILGGHDRGLDWSSFACFATRLPRLFCLVQGANARRIADALHAANLPAKNMRVVGDLDAAVDTARQVTPPAGVILLSPGAPSFDQFRDYTERGRRFAALAGFDPRDVGVIKGLGIA